MAGNQFAAMADFFFRGPSALCDCFSFRRASSSISVDCQSMILADILFACFRCAQLSRRVCCICCACCRW
uniref:HDC14627 n=1 Tax=Drosophila melanogaster TaxID=7227 RepID=Q6IJM0_DROME|nr:TPA_inf: HDC14627 [Drosophila melanogaster]